MADSHRIIIQPDGPLFVRGWVPLTVLPSASPSLSEREALRTDESRTRVRPVHALCRCGISRMMPYCDGVHLRIEWDGQETADREHDGSDARVIEGQRADSLRDDLPLCARAGFCQQGDVSAWSLIEQTDDPQITARLKDMAALCPSGRLTYLETDAAGEAAEPLEPHIMMVPGGPFWVVGEIHLVTWEGREYALRGRRALCRCGASRNKPFCDGTHVAIAFEQDQPESG